MIVSGLVMICRRVVICTISQHEVPAAKNNCTDCSLPGRERSESLGPDIFFHKGERDRVRTVNG